MPVPFAIGHPSWEDDPEYDLESHVHAWAVPSPGGESELADMVGRLLAQPLDRGRPLWEVHVISGLDGGRTAVFTKVHLCMVDGMAGARLLEELLSPDAEPQTTYGHPLPPFPHETPGATRRAGSALRETLGRQARNAGHWLTALRRPELARASIDKLMAAAWSGLRLATRDIPELPWNAPVGRRRRLSFLRLPMDGVRSIRKVRGGTVNDVVLSVLAGGLHRYLSGTGMNMQGMELTAMVPVSLRDSADLSEMGNRISAMLVPLAVDMAEEGSRLAATCAITGKLKTTSAWTGIDALLQMLDELPPALVSLVGNRMKLSRIANLVATNVPGPREKRYLCGREVEAIYPIVPIADGLGLGLAVFSYNDALYVGLNAAAELVPDLEKLQQGIEESFYRLLSST